MDQDQAKLNQLTKKVASRRTFLAGAGTASAAALLVGCSSSSDTPPTTSTTATFTDNDILNFALNLEYLEAEFYLRAATGNGLSSADISGTGTAGAVTGGSKVPGLTAAQQSILNEIAYDEQQHVRFLRNALGSAAVARPAIDLTFFATLAQVATITSGATFTPFDNFNDFLIGAFIFEDVGVTAYHGAAGLISSAGITAGLLSAAASIMAVEAYHAAYVRTAITGIDIAGGAANLINIGNKVATLRGTLGGGNETMLKLPTSAATPSAIVAADTTNAIAFARNSDQVHHIVYGSATVGASKGGFFPAGTNSKFSVTAS